MGAGQGAPGSPSWCWSTSAPRGLHPKGPILRAACFEAAYSRGGLRLPALRGAHFRNHEECNMADPKQAAQGSAATARQSLKFAQMTRGQKAIFILKLTVSILSFGFIFPGITSD